MEANALYVMDGTSNQIEFGKRQEQNRKTD